MESILGVYEHRTVAFIDILGFKDEVKNEEKARDILEALTQVKNIASEYYTDEFHSKWFNIELTAFSDCIAISCPEAETIAVLFAALKFSQLLIKKGFLCRGSIAYGELHHKNGVIFGSSLVAAYLSETKQAIYPRIILDNEVFEIFNDSKNEADDFAGLIKQDKDGNEFINLLHTIENSNEDIKEQLSNIVMEKLTKCDNNPCIKQKLIWLQNEYGLHKS